MPSEPKDAGRQSPPPETQSGRQLHDAPASGQGTDKMDNKEQKNEDQLKNLTSNPPGPMDAVLEDKFSKDFAKK
ncbi:hypothetical protein F5B17DRAFT_432786 [Nemania serpens]|nr:hypothetical protein F5B17DRAFT_432786 [Nemania serpens]